MVSFFAIIPTQLIHKKYDKSLSHNDNIDIISTHLSVNTILISTQGNFIF